MQPGVEAVRALTVMPSNEGHRPEPEYGEAQPALPAASAGSLRVSRKAVCVRATEPATERAGVVHSVRLVYCSGCTAVGWCTSLTAAPGARAGLHAPAQSVQRPAVPGPRPVARGPWPSEDRSDGDTEGRHARSFSVCVRVCARCRRCAITQDSHGLPHLTVTRTVTKTRSRALRTCAAHDPHPCRPGLCRGSSHARALPHMRERKPPRSAAHNAEDLSAAAVALPLATWLTSPPPLAAHRRYRRVSPARLRTPSAVPATQPKYSARLSGSSAARGPPAGGRIRAAARSPVQEGTAPQPLDHTPSGSPRRNVTGGGRRRCGRRRAVRGRCGGS